MLINNPDSLKSWLIIILEPLCDADSSALARYVLALLKKEKPVKELKKVMIEQLDVFLAEETKPFVERLFNAIVSEEYLATTDISPLMLTSTVEASLEDLPAPAALAVVDLQQTGLSEITTATETSTLSFGVDKGLTPPLDDSKTKEIYSKTDEINSALDTAIAPMTVLTASPVDTVMTAACASASVSSPLSVVPAAKSMSPFKATSDKENQPRESRRRRASLRSRSRTRSRSNDRMSRRSRSRDRRPTDREKNQRQFRNKSPPSFGHGHGRRGGVDRRRGGAMNSSEVADRSPRFGGGGGTGSGKPRLNRSNSRSRSPSAERGRKSSPSAGPGVGHHSQHDSNHKRQRCRDFDEKGYCVRGETCPWDHGINPVVFEGLNNSALISMSLREYNPDAPDLWTRGAPGAPMSSTRGAIGPVSSGVGSSTTGSVGAGNSALDTFSSTTRNNISAGGGGGGGGGSGNFQHGGLTSGKANGNGLPGGYIRTAGGFRPTAPIIQFPFNPAAVTPLQRELIPVPVVDANSTGGDISANQPMKRRFELEDSVAIAEGPTKRKLPMNSRLGSRITNIQNNCSLELRKVPRGMNSIAHLNNHFAKFGKIINIQISYDGDPEAAIVTFSTHAEANVAYRSTEAVLNNRFIKVFWHSQDISTAGAGGNAQMTLLKDDVGGQTGHSGGPLNGRKNSQYHVNNIPNVPTPTADAAKINLTLAASGLANSNATGAATTGVVAATGTTIVSGIQAASLSSATSPTNAPTQIVAAAHVPPPSLRLKNNVQRISPGATNAIIRKKQEDQAKAVVQLANGLRKRKHELLQGYLKQMKSAVELVERCEPTDPQRIKTVATINVLHETIEKLRKEIAAEQEQIQAQIQNQQPPVKKTKEQQKKELLDIELELFAQQQEGNDTTAIQKRLEDLQRSLGIGPGGLSGSAGTNASGGGGKPHFPSNRVNNRVRPTLPIGSTSVDRRPKSIVITGFASEDCDFVLGHFKHFGEITKHDADRTKPQLIITYATRLNAEQAVLRGKLFKDKRLQICWAPVVPTPNLPPKPAENISSSNNEFKANDKTASNSDIETTDTLPELRLEDEEEEDESEDRSWRR